MEESLNFNNLLVTRNLKYNLKNNQAFIFNITNLTVDNAVKNWTFTSKELDMRLALLSNDDENITKLLASLVGINNIIAGNILINNVDVTYNMLGFERAMSYVDMEHHNWNKLFSVQHNLIRTALHNKPFLQEVSDYNQKIKTNIANLKNTGLNLDCGRFKEKLVVIIKNFIYETQNTRLNFIKEYEYQIKHFHYNFVAENFKFDGCENLVKILIKKFMAEEENIIANNNLLFLQSLQDRIASLETLVGPCFCGCEPPKEKKSAFKLREIIFVIKEINLALNKDINKSRIAVRTTLKSCNNYNQVFTKEFNHLLAYKQLTVSRVEIEQVLEQWIDLAEVQRIKFNMKQDFVAMQLLPDEMHLLLKNIKDEIKVYHEKLLQDPELQDKEIYNKQLTNLYEHLIDIRDLIQENITIIFNHLQLTNLLSMRLTQLSPVQKRLVQIIQQLVVPIKILVLNNPLELLEDNDKIQLSAWIKAIQSLLHFGIIFSTNNQVDIDLLASDLVVIENEHVIQQGPRQEVVNKPLSLNLLKEINKQQINIAPTVWKAPTLFFNNVNIGKFNVNQAPIVAFKADSPLFSHKKPKFLFLKKCIVIKGMIKEVTTVNDKQLLLMFETINSEQLTILTNNNGIIIAKNNIGWITLIENSLFIFDGETKQLIGTW